MENHTNICDIYNNITENSEGYFGTQEATPGSGTFKLCNCQEEIQEDILELRKPHRIL